MPIVMHEGPSDVGAVAFMLTLIIFGVLFLIVTYALAFAKAIINERSLRSEIEDSALLSFFKIGGWACISIVVVVFIFAAVLAGVTCLIS